MIYQLTCLDLLGNNYLYIPSKFIDYFEGNIVVFKEFLHHASWVWRSNNHFILTNLRIEQNKNTLINRMFNLENLYKDAQCYFLLFNTEVTNL